MRLPPPSRLSQNAYPNAFDPQLHFDANVKRISHALAPPSIPIDTTSREPASRMHIRNRPPPRPLDDRPLFFDEPDPIAPLPLFVQELPRLARARSENDRLPRRVEMRDEEDFPAASACICAAAAAAAAATAAAAEATTRSHGSAATPERAREERPFALCRRHPRYPRLCVHQAGLRGADGDGRPPAAALARHSPAIHQRARGHPDPRRAGRATPIGPRVRATSLVKIALSLLGWADLKAGGVAADWVTTTWGQPEQEAALWLLLDWLYPSKALLYPLDEEGGDGASKKPATKRGGRRDPAELLLPPKMLLPYGAVPRILACLGRRKLFNASEATPYLTQAAATLIELDAGGRPSWTSPEMILYWMELWGCWDTSRWPRDVDRIPAPERCRPESDAASRPRQRSVAAARQAQAVRMEQTNQLIL